MVLLQISIAIKERSEAEEASVRLNVMREDEAKFRKKLQAKRKEQLEVCGLWEVLWRVKKT